MNTCTCMYLAHTSTCIVYTHFNLAFDAKKVEWEPFEKDASAWQCDCE